MKVLFLDQFSELGGAQRVLIDTIDAARARGWRVQVAIPGSGPLADQLRARGVSTTQIPCGPYRSGTKSVVDLLRFGSDMRGQKHTIGHLARDVDLIYVNGPRLLPAAALVSRQRLPVLFHAHSHVGQGLARRLAGSSIRRTHATVVACSQSVLDSFHEYTKSHGAFVIPNGVPEIAFRERGPIRRIGVVGRISPEKGQAEFVRAAHVLHPKFPDVRFVVRGAPLFADSSYFRSIQELARGLPIEFLGWSDDVVAIMRDLDLLVVPSRHEGMGRVIVEAFSAGLPVVAFAVGGIPEVITDGETGFLVEEATPDALARRIAEVLKSDAHTLQRITVQARRAWELRYNLTIYQERITHLMKRLTSTSPST